jgi:hypothetical protein
LGKLASYAFEAEANAYVRGGRTRLIWLGAWLGALLPSAVAAQGSGVAFNWVRLAGAESCVSASELMNRVEERAGRVLFVRSGDARLSIDGYVRASDDPRGWAVRLAVSQPDGRVLGSRDLDVLVGDDCSVIDEAVEFLVHVTLDADGAFNMGIPLSAEARQLLDQALGNEPFEGDRLLLLGMSSDSSRPARESAPPPPSAASPAQTTALPAAEARPSSALFDMSAAAGVGRIPGVSFGLALHVSLLTSADWRLELGLGVWPARRVEADGSPGHADFDALIGSLAICPWQFWQALALCAGAEYGRMGVVPSGFKESETSSSALFDVFGTGVLHFHVAGPLQLRAALVLTVPMIRHEYVFETSMGSQRLFRTSPVLAHVELGVGVQL